MSRNVAKKAGKSRPSRSKNERSRLWANDGETLLPPLSSAPRAGLTPTFTAGQLPSQARPNQPPLPNAAPHEPYHPIANETSMPAVDGPSNSPPSAPPAGATLSDAPPAPTGPPIPPHADIYLSDYVDRWGNIPRRTRHAHDGRTHASHTGPAPPISRDEPFFVAVPAQQLYPVDYDNVPQRTGPRSTAQQPSDHNWGQPWGIYCGPPSTSDPAPPARTARQGNLPEGHVHDELGHAPFEDNAIATGWDDEGVMPPPVVAPRRRGPGRNKRGVDLLVKRTTRTKKKERWPIWREKVLPRIVAPFIAMREDQKAGISLPSLPTAISDLSCCALPQPHEKPYELTLVDFATVRTIQLVRCKRCRTPLAPILVRSGWFPCSPSRPQAALSVDLLRFFHCQNLRHTQSVSAWSQGIAAYLRGRGAGWSQKVPLQSQFPEAVTWYDALERMVRRHVDSTIRTVVMANTTLPYPSPAPAIPMFGPQPPQMQTSSQRPLGDTGGSDDKINDLLSERPRRDAQSDQMAQTRKRAMPSDPSLESSSKRRRTTDTSPDTVFTDAPIGQGGAEAPPPAKPVSPKVTVEEEKDLQADVEQPNQGLDDAEEPPWCRPLAPPGRTSRPIRGLADPILSELCPLCFGGEDWGGNPETDPDAHVCIDGAPGHRQLKSVLIDPEIIPNERFISDELLDWAEAYVDQCRNGTAVPHRSGLPEHILDLCEKSYTAANQRRQQAQAKIYRTTGAMALVCRHDIPLLFANIRGGAEAHYYAVALLWKLYSMLPKGATIGLLYDISCQLDRGFKKHGYLPELAKCLSFATAVLHAYGHQYACQVVFHPRKRLGFALTNGEGCERVWAWLSDLIPSERLMAPHKREFTFEGKVAFIGEQHRNALGSWNAERLELIEELETEADKVLAKCEFSPEQLEAFWKAQQEHQMSLRAWNKQKADKDIATFIRLQESHAQLEKNLQEAAAFMTNTAALKLFSAPQSEHAFVAQLKEFQALRAEHQEMGPKLGALAENLGAVALAKGLGASVTESQLPFVRLLAQCRTQKQLLRSKLTGRQFEFEPLLRTKRRRGQRGRRRAKLGTVQHQFILKRIQRRSRAVQNSLKKYNTLCRLIAAYKEKPPWVRGPTDLPQEIDGKAAIDLTTDASIWHDVWMGDDGEASPQWYSNPAVREGILMTQQRARCGEERERLAREGQNLTLWFTRTIGAALAAASQAQASPYLPIFKQKVRELLRLRMSMLSPFFTIANFHEGDSEIRRQLRAGAGAELLPGAGRTADAAGESMTTLDIDLLETIELEQPDDAVTEMQVEQGIISMGSAEDDDAPDEESDDENGDEEFIDEDDSGDSVASSSDEWDEEDIELDH